MSLLHVFGFKFLPHVSLLWRKLLWRCAALLILGLLSLAPIVLLAPIGMLVAPIILLWRLFSILLAPIAVLVWWGAALLVHWLLLSACSSTHARIV